VIVLDTSGLLSLLDASQKQHRACVRALTQVRAPLLLSPFVLAEVDYLLATRIGVAEESAFLDEVASGAYQLEPFSASDVAQAREIVDRYRDLEIGLADASIVVLCARHDTRDVLTLDERHFRALRTGSGKRFRILPADVSPAVR
jgi:predicted nucleic acid-binding protein